MGQVGFGERLLVDDGVGYGGEGFAKLEGLGEGCGLLLRGGVEALEFAQLAVGDQVGLVGEAEQGIVVREQVNKPGGVKAVVEGVDQVESGMASVEFEGLWRIGFGGHDGRGLSGGSSLLTL